MSSLITSLLLTPNQVVSNCQALSAFADLYATRLRKPKDSEIVTMIERAVRITNMLESYKWMACHADPAPTHTTYADLNHSCKSPRDTTAMYHSSHYTITSSLDGLFWRDSESEDPLNQGAHGSKSISVRIGPLESKNESQGALDYGVQNTGAYWESNVDIIHNEGKYNNGIVGTFGDLRNNFLSLGSPTENLTAYAVPFLSHHRHYGMAAGTKGSADSL
ncbi:hypothetical protein RhiLY_09477 [Ceratobasidium sp. AG-Ba]|nr:hypothetical protein RhiLY_09477 [Ceratobasidium sp. AG-Ba]